eukprot:3118165-Rhodomonas_salina.3
MALPQDQGRTAREWVVPEDCSTIQVPECSRARRPYAVSGTDYALGRVQYSPNTPTRVRY